MLNESIHDSFTSGLVSLYIHQLAFNSEYVDRLLINIYFSLWAFRIVHEH